MANQFGFTIPQQLQSTVRQVNYSVNLGNVLLRMGKAKLFRSTGAGLQGTRPEYLVQEIEIEEDVKKSEFFGTPVFSNFLVEAGAYQDSQGNVIDYDGFNIDTCLFEVSQTKNIVRTTVQGRDGTVKEYIAEGDYEITARGIINNAEDLYNYPEDQVKAVIEVCRVPDSIKVTSDFLGYFGIDYVVITDFRFNQVAGMQAQQEFQITMASDRLIDLDEI